MLRRAIVLAHRFALEGGSALAPESVFMLRETLEELERLGIEEVCVVDGPQAEELAERLEVSKFLRLRVTVLANRSWRHATGSAVLVAREFLSADKAPCLIIRGDHALAGAEVRTLVNTRLEPHDGVLVVAPLENNCAPGPSDVRVKLRRIGRPGATSEISQIGYDLDCTGVISSGNAVITDAVLPYLEVLNNPTIEDGLSGLLANGGLVRAQMGAPVLSSDVCDEVEDKVEAILETKAHPRYTLLNPGPVNTTARVKSALVHHDVCHRDSNFSELMVSLVDKLRRIFRGGPTHTVCLITGSGTAAMESALASSVPRNGKVLVVDNGAFGQRLCEIVSVHDMELLRLKYEWGSQIDPGDIARALEEHPDIAAVAMVHHETSVGLLNPVNEVGKICREHGALFLVDAVSALGAEDIDVVRDHIDICWASANKCLHAISGVGFLCVAPRAWERVEGIPPRSYYLDMQRYRSYVEDKAQTPFTPAVSTYFALEAACSEFLADGHSARMAMYRRRNRILRTGLTELGMDSFTNTGNESHSVVTCRVPVGATFEEMYEGLKSRGYIVYGCKDVLAGAFFQVANMGDLQDDHLNLFLLACRDVIAELRGRHKRALVSA